MCRHNMCATDFGKTYLVCMNRSLKRERLLQTIGGRKKMFDLSSKENGTEQIFFWGGGRRAPALHFGKWKAYFLNDF